MTAPATWYAAQGANDTYFRVRVPAKAVGAKVEFIPVDQGVDLITQPHEDGPFPWRQTEDGAEYPCQEGSVAVWTRPDMPRAIHAVAMAEGAGVRIVAEVDDNYLADPKFNEALANSHRVDGAKMQQQRLRALCAFDAVIFSTAWLLNFYWRRIRSEGRRRIALTSIGNHLDAADWPAPKPQSDRLRVGWMGGPSHAADLELAYPALEWAAQQGHEVVLIGYNPATRPSPQCDRWLALAHRHVPWVDPRVFGRPAQAWPLDIALAPLVTDEFTLGKSDVKAVEYATANAAVVAQNNPVYNRTLRHNETALLAGSPAEFKAHVKTLCQQPKLRRRLADALTQYAREERTIQTHAEEWRHAVFG